MSDPIAVDPHRTRDRLLVVAGAILIAATYSYLILSQPAEIAASGTSRAGLIAMAGYLVGAVLIAAGSVRQIPTAVIAMIPVAIALNIVAGQIVSTLSLTVYLDSIGTVLVSVLAGPAAGVVTGILSNVIWGLTLTPIPLPFAVVQVVIAVLAGLAARAGVFRHVYLPPLAGVLTGFVTAMVSAPIAAFVFGGATGGSAGAIVGAFQAMGRSLLEATTLQGLLYDPLDKAITFTVVGILIAALPARFLQRFPFARTYRVFGKGPLTRTPTTSAG